jgi:ankyrin repeat protein
VPTPAETDVVILLSACSSGLQAQRKETRVDDTDAVPLAPRPSLEQYRKQAKELARAGTSADPQAIRAWAAQWLATLARLHGQPTTPELREQLERKAEQIHRFARTVAARSRARGGTGALAWAQFVLARAHGFDSWSSLSTQIRALVRPAGSVAAFESAVDATVNGDIAALDGVLRRHPELARARSARRHQATLLHYASANGVEAHRQRTPQHAVQIAERLLDAGADVNAPHCPTPRRRAGTALGLVATSLPAVRARVQIPLMQALLDAGAAVDGVPGGWQPLLAALANGSPEAAELLARHGARMTMVAAAGLGRLDLVVRYFHADGRLRPDAFGAAVPGLPAEPRQQVGRALICAATYGHPSVVEFLLDSGADIGAQDDAGQTALHQAVHGGHLSTVELLLQRGAPLDVTNVYGGTVLGQAIWSAANLAGPSGTGSGAAHLAVVERLIAAGARTRE